jgi:hypothetical protein
MPGLVPGIHALAFILARKAWMAGTSPAMTSFVTKTYAPYFTSGQPLSFAVGNALSPGTTASCL